MTVSDRMKLFRKSLKPKVSQESFGASLGKSQTAYAKYEAGIVKPDETFLRLLCLQYGVNMKWLCTGEGAMRKDAFNKLIPQSSLTSEEQEFISAFPKLPYAEQKAVLTIMKAMVHV